MFYMTCLTDKCSVLSVQRWLFTTHEQYIPYSGPKFRRIVLLHFYRVLFSNYKNFLMPTSTLTKLNNENSQNPYNKF